MPQVLGAYHRATHESNFSTAQGLWHGSPASPIPTDPFSKRPERRVRWMGKHP